ncbi:MAG: hypothetical protein K5776_08870 [Lachnospiraceae bacterium]|nr:hypothetical protein [Lachnospiraceae bacterium]
MAGKKLSDISIGNGITALVLVAIWLVLQTIFGPESTSPASLMAVETIIYDFSFFVSFILGLIGVIYSLIILPFCIKENKIRWVVGFALNLIALIIPGIVVFFLGFIIYCLTNPFG